MILDELMSLKDKLDIVLITYNRKELLEKTLVQVFAPNSPIKDFDITILNNASTDGTTELINEYCYKYQNIKHIINRKNIGGCANIAKALVEVPLKQYVWVLCDNDSYDWSVWNEIKKAADENYDLIYTRTCNNSVSDIFYTATLVSGCIYKTDLITDTVAENIYDYIKFLFPHLAITAQVINHNKSIYIPSKDIVYSGINPEHDTSFVRGNDINDLSEARRNIFWSVGYFSTVELVKDRTKRREIIDGARHYHKSLSDLFKTVMVKNKINYNNYRYNFSQIFRVLNLSQKLKFIFAFLSVNLSLKNYKFYEIRSKKQWLDYFDCISEQKYLDKLSKKLKGKKVLLYGAGIISETILENYDLSKFNIAGIADKRFERTDEKEFCGLKTFKPDELKSLEYDNIIITLKLYDRIKKILKESGINKKTYSVIRKTNRYVIRT